MPRNNIEKERAYRRAWCAKNKDKVKAYQKKYSESNPASIKASQARYRANNSHRHAEWWARLKQQVFSLYVKKCSKCGFDDERALQLDHVNNDGFKFRIRRRSGIRTTKSELCWIDAAKSYQPDKYQILCANCNWIKRYECTRVTSEVGIQSEHLGTTGNGS